MVIGCQYHADKTRPKWKGQATESKVRNVPEKSKRRRYRNAKRQQVADTRTSKPSKARTNKTAFQTVLCYIKTDQN